MKPRHPDTIVIELFPTKSHREKSTPTTSLINEPVKRNPALPKLPKSRPTICTQTHDANNDKRQLGNKGYFQTGLTCGQLR